MRKPRCIIIGCGGHGRVVLDILLNAGVYEPAGFIDSDPRLTGRRVDGLHVLGPPDDLPRIRDDHDVRCAIVAVGDNRARRALTRRVPAFGLKLVNAIHPSANIARNATLGRNVVVAAGALLCAHARVGDSAILNTGCIVDHECSIAPAVHVCPGAKLAGRVTVESGAFVGIGATVIQNIRIGREAVIGAGAVVIHDAPPMTTVVGVPARPIRTFQKLAEAPARILPHFDRADAPYNVGDEMCCNHGIARRRLRAEFK